MAAPEGEDNEVRFFCKRCWMGQPRIFSTVTEKAMGQPCPSRGHNQTIENPPVRAAYLKIKRYKWFEVRRPPQIPTPTNGYEFCVSYNHKNRCTTGAKCTFAHSEPERLHWQKLVPSRRRFGGEDGDLDTSFASQMGIDDSDTGSRRASVGSINGIFGGSGSCSRSSSMTLHHLLSDVLPSINEQRGGGDGSPPATLLRADSAPFNLGGLEEEAGGGDDDIYNRSADAVGGFLSGRGGKAATSHTTWTSPTFGPQQPTTDQEDGLSRSSPVFGWSSAMAQSRLGGYVGGLSSTQPAKKGEGLFKADLGTGFSKKGVLIGGRPTISTTTTNEISVRNRPFPPLRQSPPNSAAANSAEPSLSLFSMGAPLALSVVVKVQVHFTKSSGQWTQSTTYEVPSETIGKELRRLIAAGREGCPTDQRLVLSCVTASTHARRMLKDEDRLADYVGLYNEASLALEAQVLSSLPKGPWAALVDDTSSNLNQQYHQLLLLAAPEPWGEVDNEGCPTLLHSYLSEAFSHCELKGQLLHYSADAFAFNTGLWTSITSSSASASEKNERKTPMCEQIYALFERKNKAPSSSSHEWSLSKFVPERDINRLFQQTPSVASSALLPESPLYYDTMDMAFVPSLSIHMDAFQLFQDAESQTRATAVLRQTDIPSRYWETILHGAALSATKQRVLAMPAAGEEAGGQFLIPFKFCKEDDGAALLIMIEFVRSLHGKSYYQARKILTREEGYVQARLVAGKALDAEWVGEVLGSQALSGGLLLDGGDNRESSSSSRVLVKEYKVGGMAVRGPPPAFSK